MIKNPYRKIPYSKLVMDTKRSKLDRILRVWDEMPDIGLCQLIAKSTKGLDIGSLSDDELIKLCYDYLPIYKKQNSWYNKVLNGVKSFI